MVACSSHQQLLFSAPARDLQTTWFIGRDRALTIGIGSGFPSRVAGGLRQRHRLWREGRAAECRAWRHALPGDLAFRLAEQVFPPAAISFVVPFSGRKAAEVVRRLCHHHRRTFRRMVRGSGALFVSSYDGYNLDLRYATKPIY